jgi:ADP-heptose:LPS heptosyltransferase
MVQSFSIQKDLRDNDAEMLNAHPDITHLGNELIDFQDTAAVMMSLDLIISSDTAVVNLAGALGRPLWVLLSFIPDWRWLLDRADSPWYPTARLFRQNKNGDWGSVVEDARNELERLVLRRQFEAR